MTHRPEGRRTPLANLPFDPSRFPLFYGWIVLGAGTLGMVMSAPGQTVGVSVFTDHLIEALGVTRNQLSLGYLVGTLASSLLLSRAGRSYDRYGARRVAAVAAAALALTLVYFSFSPEISDGIQRVIPGGAAIGFVTATVGFFLLRFSGQGVLTLASRNMVMEWFEKRRGMANAVMGVSISFGFSYAPRIFESLVGRSGWQGAWRWIAAGVALFIVIIVVFYRDTPEAHGMVPDGGEVKARRTHPETESGASFTLSQARRTYAFWVFALAVFLSSLLVTAYTFHIVSIFAEAGRPRAQAVAVFFPSSIVSVALQFAGSWLSDRIRLKYLAVVQMAGAVVLSAGLIFLSGSWGMVLVIAGHGMTIGMFSILSNLTWPRFFGRVHLGAVSGFAMALGVAGSAVGPYLFSFGRQLSGSYAVPALASGVIGAALLIASFRANRPDFPG